MTHCGGEELNLRHESSRADNIKATQLIADKQVMVWDRIGSAVYQQETYEPVTNRMVLPFYRGDI